MTENTFAKVLISDRAEKNLSLFGRFVGEWDFESCTVQEDGTVDKIKGEWIFSYVLEGTAIQDVFICPNREERLLKREKHMEYGTTIRFPLNDGSGKWHILYVSNNGYKADRLVAEEVNGNIIQTGINYDPEDTTVWQWNFTNITEDSFCWESRWSKDNGETWNCFGKLEARRRKKSC